MKNINAPLKVRREFGSGGSPLAVVLRLELRHRNIPITHSLANCCLTY